MTPWQGCPQRFDGLQRFDATMADAARRTNQNRIVAMLLAVLPLVPSAGGLSAATGAAGQLELWVEPLRAGALQAAVDTAAASVDGPVTIHLAPGTHLLNRPLALDVRHSGMRFIGHGASISGAVPIGAVPDGGKNISGWAVVGKANCSGCSDIWRTRIPAGADARQLYVDSRRANRTWAGMPLLPLIGAKKTSSGTNITVPGELMLRCDFRLISPFSLIFTTFY